MNTHGVPTRSQIKPGMRVQIVEKHNQRNGARTVGIVARILTSSAIHPHGIKVMLTDGKVGRVQAIEPAQSSQPPLSSQGQTGQP